MESHGPGRNKSIQPLISTGDNVTPSDRSHPDDTLRQTPKPDTLHQSGTFLSDRSANIVEPSATKPDIPPGVAELYAAPGNIPSQTSLQQQNRETRFQSGAQKTMGTHVRGTGILQFLTPIDVIRTPTKGDFKGRVKAGYGNVTNQGFDIHSSYMNLDEPVAATCKNVNVSQLITLWGGAGHITLPQKSWLNNQLSPSIPVASSTPTGKHLQRTTAFDQEIENTLQQAATTQQNTEQLRSQLTETRTQVTALQQSSSDLSTDVNKLKNQAHKYTTRAAVQTSHVHQSTQTTPDSSQAAARLQSRLTELETTLLDLHTENQKLQTSHQQLQYSLEQRLSETENLKQQLEEAKTVKEALDTQCQALKQSDIEQRTRIRELQAERTKLANQILQLEDLLSRTTRELEASQHALTLSHQHNLKLQKDISLQLQQDTRLKKATEELSRQLHQTQTQLESSQETNAQTAEKLTASSVRLEAALEEALKFKALLENGRKEESILKASLETTQHENAKLKDELKQQQASWIKLKESYEDRLEDESRRHQELLTESHKAFQLTEELTNDNDALNQQLLKTQQNLSAAEGAIQQQIRELGQLKQTHDSDTEKYNQTLNRLNTEKQQLTDNLQSLEEHNTTLTDLIHQATHSRNIPKNEGFSSLEMATCQLVSEHALISRQLVVEQKQHCEDLHQLQACRRDLTEKTQELELEKEQLISAQLQLNDVCKELKASRTECEDAKGLLITAVDELEKRVESEKKLTEQNREMQGQLDSLAQQSSHKDQEIEALKQQLAQAQQSNRKLRGNNDQLQIQLQREQHVNTQNRTTIEQLQQQLHNSAKESQQVQRQVKELEQALLKSSQQAEFAAIRLSHQQEILIEAEEEFGKLQQQLHESRTAGAEQSQEITQLKNLLLKQEEVSRTNREITLKLTESENAQKELQKLIDDSHALSSELIEEKYENVAQIKALQSALSTQDNATQAALKQEIESKENTILQLDKRLKHIQKALTAAQQRTKQANQTAKDFAEQNKRQQLKLVQLVTENSALKWEEFKTSGHSKAQEELLRQTQASISTLTQRTIHLANELADVQVRQEHLNKELAQQQQDFTQQLSQLEHKLQTSETARTATEYEVKALQMTTESLKQRNTTLSKALARTQLITLGKNFRIASLTEKCAALENRQVDKSQEVSALQKAHDQLQRKWTVFEAELASLIRQIPKGPLPEEAARGENLALAFDQDTNASTEQPSAKLSSAVIKTELQNLSTEWQKLNTQQEAFLDVQSQLENEINELQGKLDSELEQNEELASEAAIRVDISGLALKQNSIKLRHIIKQLEDYKEQLHRETDRNQYLSESFLDASKELKKYQTHFGMLSEDSAITRPLSREKAEEDNTEWVSKATHTHEMESLRQKLRDTKELHRAELEEMTDEADAQRKAALDLKTELTRRNALLQEIAETNEYTLASMAAMQQQMRDISSSAAMGILIDIIEKLKYGMTAKGGDIRQQLESLNIPVKHADEAKAIEDVKDVILMLLSAAETPSAYGLPEELNTENADSESAIQLSHNQEQALVPPPFSRRSSLDSGIARTNSNTSELSDENDDASETSSGIGDSAYSDDELFDMGTKNIYSEDAIKDAQRLRKAARARTFNFQPPSLIQPVSS